MHDFFEDMMKNEMLKGAVLVGIGASIYGMLATVVKLAYNQGFTTAEVTTSQFIIGFSGLLLLNAIQTKQSKKELPKPFKKDVLQLLAAGSSLGMTSLFYYLSVQFIDVSIAIVMLMQSVWIGIGIDSVIHRQFPNSRKIISTVVILFGTLLATNTLVSKVDLDWRGILFGMLAAMSFATTMFASNRIANHLPVLRKSFLMVSGGMFVVLSFLIFAQVGPFYFGTSPTSVVEARAFDFSIFWKYGLFLAAFGTILPPILLNLGFPKTGLGLGSIISSLELPVSVTMAFVLLNEQVSLLQWSGILLILVAIVYMNLNSIRKPSEI